MPATAPAAAAVLVPALLLLMLLLPSSSSLFPLLAPQPAGATPTGVMPQLRDPALAVERFSSIIPNSPTTLAFVGEGDVLVLQKTDGQVRLIRDGVLQGQPVLDANVANAGEQGMLGIAVVVANGEGGSSNSGSSKKVYLYFSESDRDGGEAIAKRVYSYDWDGSSLSNPVLLRDLRATQFYHNGGGMVAAPDGAVYLVLGDAGRYGALQNHSKELFEDTSVIMRIDREGDPYHAIGVRNSFGLAIDPVTGRLWDTENGDDYYDEINLVEEKMNSGWDVVMGPATEDALARIPQYLDYRYSDPEFSWERPVAPTGLAFVGSGPLQEEYGDSLFVGDCNNGNLYRFVLNESRDGFVFAQASPLQDGVAGAGEPQDEIIFGTDFGCVTDVEVGPDGLLYVLSLSEGTIFRIGPKDVIAALSSSSAVAAGGGGPLQQALQGPAQLAVYSSVAAAGAAAAGVYVLRRRKSKNNNNKPL